ncbi:endonuclease V [Pseudonocardia sp. CA-107938]|uniref:endonuclease V n=1 Tax=Pseudonocardia sp. CA-107938 TaxID=3240021 RepID=UPI003D8CECF1
MQPDRIAAAVAMQERLAPLVRHTPPAGFVPRIAAGCDVAYSGDGTGAARVAAAVVCIDVETGAEVASATATGTTDFPYVPGLFAFRELPILLDALGALRTVPDLLVADGHGVAHPRRFGLASHLGVATGLPTIGVAKTAPGPFEAPPRDRGAATPLLMDGAQVGAVLRTRTGVKPVFVSVGHLIDLTTASDLVLRLCRGTRLPETTRAADRRCRTVLDELATQTQPRSYGPPS